jgi:hypothetical protein
MRATALLHRVRLSAAHPGVGEGDGARGGGAGHRRGLA